jgi:hypothetical protein
MNQRYLLTILFIFSFCCAYSQEQAPSIEWIEPYNGGTRGGSVTAAQGPGTLFALVKEQNNISGSASISKFNADGLIKNQYITSEGGSSAVPLIWQYTSQEGGVLVYIYSLRIYRKYDANLNLSWEISDDFRLQNATATLANGFYILGINNKSITELKRMRNDGSIEWSVNISGFSTTISDIQTTSDDGVIIASANGLRKYSVTGNVVWSNTSILGASQLIITDPATMYTYTNNNNSGIRNIIQLNTLTGNANWTRFLNGESINDFKRTSDNGCVFSTNTGLYKYDPLGGLQWKNTNYSASKIATSGDGKIFVIKNNAITKLSLDNEQIWSKSFNSNYYIIQDINDASDFGLYVTAAKNGAYYSPGPSFFLFKLASPDTPCKTNFDITGGNATFCKTGSLFLSSKIGNVPIEYLNYLTSFSLQWYKNNAPIQFANNYSYTAFQTGNYSLKLTQQGCEATSRQVELNIISANAPIITSEKSRICAGSSTTITAQGCDGTVVWSTGERSPQIKVSPQATTSYNALCEKTFNNEICQSSTSNIIAIFVENSSGLNISQIAGKREFCENGSTELKPTVNGSFPPFSYNWTKNLTTVANTANFSPKEDGEYILHVSDNIGCFSHSDIIHIKKIENPVTPTINPPTSTILCQDGHITLSASSQESNYLWIINDFELKNEINKSYNVTVPGSYRVKVTNANGCSSMSNDAIVITLSDLNIKSINGKKELCKGNSTELQATILGGIEPYNYAWTKNDTTRSQSNPAIIKEKGDYIFKVTDHNGCTRSSQSILIKELAIPVVPVISSSSGNEICIDSKSVLTTTLKGVSYQWYLDNKEIDKANDQFYTATSPGKYELTVTNENGCSSISENAITITQIIIPQPSIKQSDDSLISSASAGNKWYLNSNELPLTSQKIKFTEMGNYQVKVIEKTCESPLSAIFLPVLLAHEPEASYIKVYPNPSSDKVFINSSRMFTYTLVNASGKLLKQSQVKQNTHIIEIADFSAGSYLIAMQEENGNTITRKIIVNR